MSIPLAGVDRSLETVLARARGDAAVNEGFANEIGADGYAENAIDAVEIAKALIGKT